MFVRLFLSLLHILMLMTLLQVNSLCAQVANAGILEPPVIKHGEQVDSIIGGHFEYLAFWELVNDMPQKEVVAVAPKVESLPDEARPEEGQFVDTITKGVQFFDLRLEAIVGLGTREGLLINYLLFEQDVTFEYTTDFYKKNNLPLGATTCFHTISRSRFNKRFTFDDAIIGLNWKNFLKHNNESREVELRSVILLFRCEFNNYVSVLSHHSNVSVTSSKFNTQTETSCEHHGVNDDEMSHYGNYATGYLPAVVLKAKKVIVLSTKFFDVDHQQIGTIDRTLSIESPRVEVTNCQLYYDISIDHPGFVYEKPGYILSVQRVPINLQLYNTDIYGQMRFDKSLDLELGSVLEGCQTTEAS